MKTIKTITEKRSVFICDYCNASMPYQGYCCHRCGKEACGSCWLQLVAFEEKQILRLDDGRYHGTGVSISCAYFCKECFHKRGPLVDGLAEYMALRNRAVDAFDEYRRKQYALANELNALIHKARTKLGIER